MNNIIKIFIVIGCSLAIATSIFCQTQLNGMVIDATTGEPILIGKVTLYNDSILVAGTETDFDGNYFLLDIKPGIYYIEASYVGYQNTRVTDVIIKKDKRTIVDVEMSEGVMMDEVDYKVPLVEFDNTTSGATITAKEWALPITNLGQMSPHFFEIIKGLGKKKEVKRSEENARDISKKGDVSIRGSRSEATHFYIDGVSVSATEAAKHFPESKKEIVIEDFMSNIHSEALAPVMEEDYEDVPAAGQLTAAEWNDLNNWEDWKELSDDGVYKSMTSFWGMELGERFAVFVTNDSNIPMPNCQVVLEGHEGEVFWSAVTDNAGRAELWLQGFSVEKVGGIRVKQGTVDKVYSDFKTSDEGSNHLVFNADCKSYNKLDIMFVVDVTSSMGDEINFLRAELIDVIEQSTAQLEDEIDVRLGSVFYKDKGDDYLTAVSPLDSDISKTMNFIGSKNAGGGGDTPEAVEAGISEALEQDWDDKALSRLMFLVLDAPPHHNDDVLNRLDAQIKQAAQLGIKIIPITASGLDRETEYLMKAMSIATNGTYVFLTDDSGIGHAHLTPVVSEYDVELLNELLIRLISNYSSQEDCLSNELTSDHSFKIFPNPTTSGITINYKGEIDEIALSSSTGKRVKMITNFSAGAKVDLSDLVSGIYQVAIKRNGQILDTQSVVKI